MMMYYISCINDIIKGVYYAQKENYNYETD